MWQNVSFHCLEGLLSLEEKVFSEEDSTQIAHGRTWKVKMTAVYCGQWHG